MRLPDGADTPTDESREASREATPAGDREGVKVKVIPGNRSKMFEFTKKNRVRTNIFSLVMLNAMVPIWTGRPKVREFCPKYLKNHETLILEN